MWRGLACSLFTKPIQGLASGRDNQPVIAPDGRQLVFSSDRSGSYALWWGDVTRPQSLRLIHACSNGCR